MSKFYRLRKSWAGLDPATKSVATLAELNLKSESDVDHLVAAGIVEKGADASDVVMSDVVSKAMPAMTDAVTKALEPLLQKWGGLAGTGKLDISVSQGAADKTKSFGDFLGCVVKGDVERIHNVYATTKAPLSEASGTGGGYLVPPEFMATLLRISAEKGVVRPRARVIPMTTRTLQIPALEQGTPGANGKFQVLGGLVASWTEEATTRAETEPLFRQIELIAHELAGYSVASRSLMADSAVALDALLTGLFADAIAMHEDYAFLAGDGVGKPMGVLNSGALLTGGPNAGVNRTTSNQFKLADAAWMLSRMMPSSLDNAVWVMSQTLIPYLLQLQDTAGNVVWIPNFYNPSDGQMGGAQHSMVPILFGRPIIFTEKLPAIGSVGDVLFVDLSFYLLGDRQSIEIAASEHVNFLKNQMTWRFLHRVDGRPWLNAPYKYQDGTTQVSPFIALAA